MPKTIYNINNHLDISTICGHKIFIDIGACLPHPRLWRVHRATAANLAEEPLGAASGRGGIVDDYVVILKLMTKFHSLEFMIRAIFIDIWNLYTI